jgi:hypothetical protein
MIICSRDYDRANRRRDQPDWGITTDRQHFEGKREICILSTEKYIAKLCV